MGDYMVNLKIDERPVSVSQGTTVLEAAAKASVEIPTLCHHKELTPEWGCRLCIVELSHPHWDDGYTRIDAACSYPAEEGLEVRTDSDRVIAQRKIILQLLLSRAPGSEQLKSIADFYEVEESPYIAHDMGESNCIVCGLCMRVCNEVMGADAIGTAFRGVNKTITSPFNIASRLCIGCLACVRLCPTGALQFRLVEGRLIKEDWGVNLAMKMCDSCGKPVGAEKQIKKLKDKIPVDEEILSLCPECRRKKQTSALRKSGKKTERKNF